MNPIGNPTRVAIRPARCGRRGAPACCGCGITFQKELFPSDDRMAISDFVDLLRALNLTSAASCQITDSLTGQTISHHRIDGPSKTPIGLGCLLDKLATPFSAAPPQTHPCGRFAVYLVVHLIHSPKLM